jgi:DNA-binding MarR family transcriptional regulator
MKGLNPGWTESVDSWSDLDAAGERLDIRDFPTFHFLRLAGLAKNNLTRRYLDPFNLSLPEWRLLTLIATHSPLPFAEVPRRTLMDKGQVSRTLRVLQKKGYVVSESAAGKVKPAYRRIAPRVMVGITAEGIAIYEKIVPIAQRDQVKLIETLSPDERRLLLGFMSRMCRYMQDLDER